MKTRICKVLDGANQRELAGILGISPQAISGWKSRGTIDTENAVSLAKLRGFNPVWLISGEGPEKLDQSLKPTIEDPVLLAATMDAVDAVLAKEKLEWKTIKKARLIKHLYNIHVYSSNAPSQARLQAQVIELFEAFA